MRRILLGAALVLAGCATVRPVDAKATYVEAPIRAAEELKAAAVPKSQLHLQYAKDQLAQAKKLQSDKEERRAELMMLRAQADAELALALAKEADTTAEADAAQAPPDATN